MVPLTMTLSHPKHWVSKSGYEVLFSMPQPLVIQDNGEDVAIDGVCLCFRECAQNYSKFSTDLDEIFNVNIRRQYMGRKQNN